MNSYFIPYKNSGGTIIDWDFQSIIHCLTWSNTTENYPQTSVPLGDNKYKGILMHRLLMKFPIGVDHINGRRNDNRYINLRKATKRQNNQNRFYHRVGNLVGASFHKRDNKWRARTTIDNKQIHIGNFNTEIEAHIAYKMYLRGI
jgi:hypothetical protein